jgi:hypothetical protein
LGTQIHQNGRSSKGIEDFVHFPLGKGTEQNRTEKRKEKKKETKKSLRSEGVIKNAEDACFLNRCLVIIIFQSPGWISVLSHLPSMFA